MSALEIPYRLNQEIKKRIDRHFYRRVAKRLDVYELRIPEFDRAELRKILEPYRKELLGEAQNILYHQFDIFGIQYACPEEIDWHFDPKTKNRWPMIFWGNINYRDSSEIGGIKFAWEINRLHHLPRLALAFALSGKIQYRDKVFEQLASWMSANPYPLGINWISGIELGIRLVNLFFALRYMGLDDLSDDENLLLGEFIETHANHLYRYPSKYSSCANHALTEALGMLTAGLCCPSHPKADSWRGYGREVLDHEVMRQIYPDGSSFEHSVPYLQFVADHFLIYRKISEWYGHSWEGALVSECSPRSNS